NGVWRKRSPDLILHFWQARMVAVDRARRGENKAGDAGIPGRHEHVDETVNVYLMRRKGIGNRTRYGTQGGLVEHVVDVFACPAAGVEIPNVAFDEVERATGGRFGRLFEVVPVSG